MIDTKAVRRELEESFDRTSVFAVAYEQIPALCDALDAANARAERLADAADNVINHAWGYDENTINNDVYCIDASELSALREALEPYMDEPGDLGEP